MSAWIDGLVHGLSEWMDYMMDGWIMMDWCKDVWMNGCIAWLIDGWMNGYIQFD